MRRIIRGRDIHVYYDPPIGNDVSCMAFIQLIRDDFKPGYKLIKQLMGEKAVKACKLLNGKELLTINEYETLLQRIGENI